MANKKIIKQELRRKFVHIATGVFIAFWPWWLSWRQIQLAGLLMLLVVLANRIIKAFDFNNGVRRKSYGDITFALAIGLSALMTHIKIFFALAILILALADGLAALVGRRYGRKWQYKILGQNKSVVGSMTFWFVSLYILGNGLLLDHGIISLSHYLLVLASLPPLLAILENISVYGLDNLVIPVVAIAVLNAAV